MDFHTIKWILSFDNWNQRIWLAKQARKDIRSPELLLPAGRSAVSLPFLILAEFQIVCIHSCRIYWMMMKILGIVWSLLKFQVCSASTPWVGFVSESWKLARDGRIAMLGQCPCRKRRCARQESAGDLSWQICVCRLWQCCGGKNNVPVLPLVIVWMENDPTVWWLLRPASYFWFVKHLSSVTERFIKLNHMDFYFSS